VVRNWLSVDGVRPARTTEDDMSTMHAGDDCAAAQHIESKATSHRAAVGHLAVGGHFGRALPASTAGG
jgi:hypothetical protein